MASMRTLRGLYAMPARQRGRGQVRQTDVPAEPTPLELAERSLPPVRRRFALQCRGAEAYTLDAPAAIMSTMHASVPMDRGDDLRAMAARDFVRRVARPAAPTRRR